MNDKELRKLSRKQLLELLLKQTERSDELEAQLEEAQKKLEERNLQIKEAGSIAEAALRLNGVFEAAEKAAAQYIENVKSLSENGESPVIRSAECNYDDAEAKLREAEKKYEFIEQKAEKKLKETYIKLRRLQKEIDELERLKKQY